MRSPSHEQDFDEILYTAADFELDERHVIKNEKVASILDRLRVRENVFLVLNIAIEEQVTRKVETRSASAV